MMLEQFFINNRWKARNRSVKDDPEASSIETWALTTVQDSIHEAFDRSLEPEKLLIATPAGEIEELLFTMPLNRKYRPSLFDVLAPRALDYYSNTSNFGSVNAGDEYAFNAPELYADTPRFSTLSFPENTRHTSGVKVLWTWQKLEALHSAEKNIEAKVFAQLSRLEHVNSQYTGDDKWEYYLAALEELSSQYKP